MLSTKRILLLIVVLALLLLLSSVLFKEQAAPQLAAPSVETPSIAMTTPVAEPQKKGPTAPVEPLVQKHPKDTQDFLNFVEGVHSHEEIYKTPARFVIAKRIDDIWIAQGDILVDPKDFVEDIGDDNSRLVRLNRVETWPNNKVPYQIDATLDPTPILAAISAMNAQTHVKFVQAQGEPDFVHFVRAETGFCLSNLGRIGGQQFIRVDPSACNFGGILHEMMHAIGFAHEHSRSDRDDHLDVHWSEMIEGAQNQFQKLTSDFSLPAPGAFDFDSVLLYSSDTASASGRPTLTRKDGSKFKANRAGLSKGDIEKINALYPKNDS